MTWPPYQVLLHLQNTQRKFMILWLHQMLTSNFLCGFYDSFNFDLTPDFDTTPDVFHCLFTEHYLCRL